MKRFITKKAVVITAAVGLALGIAGGAFAYYTTGGSSTGSATTGFTTTFTVANVTFSGPALLPGAAGDVVAAQVLNRTGAPLAFNQLEVSIAGVTENAPGSANQAAGAPPCTAADYQLTTSTVSPWQLANAGGTVDLAGKHDSALILPRSGASVPDGAFVVNGVPSLVTGNAMLTGFPVQLQELNTTANQDACQGASVQVTVTAS